VFFQGKAKKKTHHTQEHVWKGPYNLTHDGDVQRLYLIRTFAQALPSVGVRTPSVKLFAAFDSNNKCWVQFPQLSTVRLLCSLFFLIDVS
jgi:hypothetical protein